jgi:hypothetical protein
MVRAKMEGLIDSVPIEWKTRLTSAIDRDEKAHPQKKRDAKASAQKKGEKNKISEVEKEAAAIWHIAEAAMRRLLHESSELLEMIPGGPASSLKTKGTIWPDQPHLTDINNKLTTLSKEIITEIREGRFSTATAAPGQNLFHKTDAYEQCLFTRILGDKPDPIRNEYEGFLSLDIHLFPLELMSDLREKDVIETIRISPSDAEKGFSNKGLSDKVSGDALYHFGGFFKRSWRSNDILWGRLDGLCQLIETLLARDVLKEVIENDIWRNEIRALLFKNPLASDDTVQWITAMDPAMLFPQAGEKTHNRLRGWLLKLLSKSDRDEAIEKKLFGEMVGLLIEAAQLEILYEEVPNVITDALSEQGQWNQFQLSIDKQEQAADRKKKSARKRAYADEEMSELGLNPFGYQSANGSLDPFIAIIAATGRAEDVMGTLKENEAAKPEAPSQTKLGRFFKNQYQVGTEELLHDMPTIILLEILSTSLLVLRNCVLGIFGDRAEKIKNHPLYKFTVDFPLRIFYWLVMFIRGAPRSWKFVLAGLAIVSAFCLFVGVTWHASILYPKDSFSFLWFTVFIAAPVTILVTEAVFLYKGKLAGNKLTTIARRIIKSIIMALFIVAPFLLVTTVFVGVERVNHRLQVSIRERMPTFFGIFSTFDIEYQDLIAQIGAIIIYVLALVLPYLGATWLIRVGRSRNADKKGLEQALVSYFTASDIERIARKLVESEMIRSKSLCDVLCLYMNKKEIARVRRRIRASEEIEAARLEEVLRYYVTNDKMKKIAKQLDTILEPQSYWLRKLRKLSRRNSGSAQLKDVLKDYVRGKDSTAKLEAAVKKLAPASRNKWLYDTAQIAERIQSKVSARNWRRFPCQRKLVSGELVRCFELKATLEDQLKIPPMTRVIAARLGIKRPKKTEPDDGSYEDSGKHLAICLDVKKATRIAMKKLEGAMLIEYTKLRRVIEEELNIAQVVSLINKILGQPKTIKWGDMKEILSDYAEEREIQQIAENLLASRKIIWDKKEKMKEKVNAKLTKYFSPSEIEEINKRIKGLNKNIAWAELRKMLKDFASEDEVRIIATDLASGFAFPWQKWEWSLRQHLTVASLMNNITGKLTSLKALANHSSTGRKAFAAEIVSYANDNEMLSRLEGQMRFINPEALYYV